MVSVTVCVAETVDVGMLPKFEGTGARFTPGAGAGFTTVKMGGFIILLMGVWSPPPNTCAKFCTGEFAAAGGATFTLRTILVVAPLASVFESVQVTTTLCCRQDHPASDPMESLSVSPEPMKSLTTIGIAAVVGVVPAPPAFETVSV